MECQQNQVVYHPGYYLYQEVITRKMSQTEMATLLGISATYLGHIVNQRRGLSLSVAKRIGEVLGQNPKIWWQRQCDYEFAHG